MYVLAPNNIVERYPYYLNNLLEDHPQVSFSRSPTLSTLAEYNVFPVISIGQPAFDSLTEKVIQINPTFSGIRWEQTWQVVSLTAEEASNANQSQADETALSYIKTDNVIQFLRDHTPAECEAYVQNNVTDLNSSKVLMKKFAAVLCVLAKQNLR